MTFTIEVNAERWRAHLRSVVDATPGIVPVVKGNGYGLGRSTLAREAAALGVAVIAVGTVYEAAQALADFPGDVLVLTPYDSRDAIALSTWEQVRATPEGHRVIGTLGDAASESATAGPRPSRVLLEGRTSLNRFGFDDAALTNAVRSLTADTTVLGLALHLPLSQPITRTPRPVTGVGTTHETAPVVTGTGKVQEVVGWGRRWLTLAEAHGVGAPDLWVSHLDPAEVDAVREQLPDVPVHQRIGTRLWLDDRDALRASGVVLACHGTRRGDHVGYRQRRAKDGWMLVVGGGTSHGIGLESPTPASTVRQRGVTAATGLLDAAGRAMSPFSWKGRRLWFAEPPHMQVSLLWLPTRDALQGPPSVGDRLPCEVRFTTVTADSITLQE